MWKVALSKQALKDAKKLGQAGLHEKAEALLEILRIDPFQNPPPFEKLVGDYRGYYSRRINRQHRLIYDIDEAERTVRVARMWSHYE